MTFSVFMTYYISMENILANVWLHLPNTIKITYTLKNAIPHDITLLVVFYTACRLNADIMFLLDVSGSVREENFKTVKEFLKDMVDRLNVGEDESNVGMISFSDNAHMEFTMAAYDTRDEIKSSIDNIPYRRGTTNTAEALRMLREEAMLPASGNRTPMRDIAVIFTDGGSNNMKNTIEEAKKAREAGITILVVAVSEWVQKNEIKEIASDPDKMNILAIENYSAIKDIGDTLESYLCDRKYLFLEVNPTI